MEWIFFALIGPLFWTISNFLDKYSIEKLTKGIADYAFFGTLGPLLILMGTPLLFEIHTSTWEVMLITGFAGFILNYSYLTYGITLAQTDTSRVVPIFQLRAPFVLIAGTLFLGEFLNGHQLLAFGIIFLGALLLSLDFASLQRPRLTTWSLYALLATVGFACVLLINNYSVANLDVPSVLVYFDTGFLFAAFTYLFYPPWRKQIIEGIKTATWKKVGLFALNDIADETAQLCSKLALVTAPATALVAVTQGIQSLYALIGGVVLTLWFPHIISEQISRRSLLQKFAGAAVVFIGLAILSLS